MKSRALCLWVIWMVGCVHTDGPTDDTDVANVSDQDGDGVPTAEDCDDTDPHSTVVAHDGDCDGVPTAEDCDDADTLSTVVAHDGDCDGVPTAEDCDDADALSTVVAHDGDCDGVPTAEDCDDADALSTVVAHDGDCDGTVTAEDCDDEDPDLNRTDVDGDGYVSCEDDCDDSDASVNPAGEDGLLRDGNCDGNLPNRSLSLADYTFVGETEDDAAGNSVASAGDVDGDGLPDFLVGAWKSDAGGEDAGMVYLILGASLDDSRDVDLSLADYRFVGEYAGDNFGKDVSSAGDVDGDGLDDILIGAYKHDALSFNAGKTYLILGASLGSIRDIDASLADYSFIDETNQGYIGHSVSSAGDVDGDGLDDLLIGAPGSYVNGMAYLILGASLGATSELDLTDSDYRFVGEDNRNDFAGGSVSRAGDVDGDGLDDLLIGAPYNADGDSGGGSGKTYLLLGANLGSDSEIELADADYRLVGEMRGDYSGFSVSDAGDVDGDGLDDILVGAFGSHDLSGKTYLLLGASLGSTSVIDLSTADYTFRGEKAGDYTGLALSGAGDVDGDGLDDILLSALGRDDFSGKSYLILGASLGSASEIDLSLADYTFESENAGDGAGASVAGVGDVNGDGRDDLLIGASSNDEGGDAAGKAYLIVSGL